MTYNVRLLPEARVDVARLEAFLATKNQRAATEAAKAIASAIRSLDTFPLRAPLGPDPDTHQLHVPFGRDGYVVRYRVRGNDVLIARIFHGLEDR